MGSFTCFSTSVCKTGKIYPRHSEYKEVLVDFLNSNFAIDATNW